MKKEFKNPIIIALDGMSEKEALKIAKLFKGKVWGFKVNDLLFQGVGIIKKLKKFGKVFADAKLHDIPNTVANQTHRLSMAGADLITIHALGGIEMMKMAKKMAGQSKILAVTILTSHYNNLSIEKDITKLMSDASRAGVDGIVCSAHELKFLQRINKNLLKVVPGIRPIWYGKKDDQKRTVTPRRAMELGADLLVVGRPITEAPDKVEALRKILAELEYNK